MTKIWALAVLENREPVRLLGGTLYMSLTRNTGAAFSMASGYTALLTLISAVVVIVIIRFASRLRSVPWGVSLGLILGGALGNLIDRVLRDGEGLLGGRVVDMVDLQWWPVFNLADAALWVGVGVLLLASRPPATDG